VREGTRAALGVVLRISLKVILVEFQNSSRKLQPLPGQGHSVSDRFTLHECAITEEGTDTLVGTDSLCLTRELCLRGEL